MSKLKELVLKNRSYRGFDRSVNQTRQELLSLIDHARLMPSTRNFQPLKYFIVNEDELVTKIQSHTKWAGSLTDIKLPFEGTEPTSFIVIVHDTLIDANIGAFQKDVGIAGAAITLAAAEQSLGCCMIGAFNPQGIKNVLNLAENLAPVLVIAVGSPIEDIILTDCENGDVTYYRGDNNLHYVPKRTLEEIVLN